MCLKRINNVTESLFLKLAYRFLAYGNKYATSYIGVKQFIRQSWIVFSANITLYMLLYIFFQWRNTKYIEWENVTTIERNNSLIIRNWPFLGLF